MIVSIAQSGSAFEIDYTKYLDEDSLFTLTQERERGAFQRVVSDISVTFSNTSEVFTNLFNVPAQTRFELMITESRLIFLGEIQRPIEFDAVNEKVTLQVFSLEKIFWDWAKATKIYNPANFASTSTYLTLQTFFDDYLFPSFDTSNQFGGGIISQVQIDSLYSGRNIRGWGTSASGNIGNNGRLKELDPETTIFEVLDACARYYNAEYYIADRVLYMIPRRSVINNLQTDVTDLICDDSSITISDTDEERFDFVYTIAKQPRITKPYVKSTVSMNGGWIQGNFEWKMTAIYSVLGSEIESDASDSSGVYSIDQSDPVKVELELSLPTGAIRRRLWRKTSTTDFVLIATIYENTSTQFYDSPNNAASTTRLPDDKTTGKVWLGYVESTNTWSILPDDGVNKPAGGEVLDAVPELTFVSINLNQKLPYNSNDVLAFFGGESDYNLGTIQEQWRDVFISRPPLKAKFQGTDYKVGDSVLMKKQMNASKLLGTNLFRIESADVDYFSEETELLLVAA